MSSMKMKPILEIRIREYANGQVTVKGPVGDLLLFRHIMNAAERCVLEELAKKNMQEKEDAKPDIQICGHLN